MLSSRIGIALSCALIAQPAWAQDAGVPDASSVVRAAELASRAKQSIALSKDIERAAAEQPATQELEASLPKLDEQLGLIERAPDAAPLRSLSLSDLDAQRVELLPLSESMEASLKSIRDRVETLQGLRRELDAERRLWASTRASLEREDLGDAAESQVDEVLAALTAADTISKQRVSTLLGLQTRVSDQFVRVSGQLAELKAARADVQAQLLLAHEPPLWRAYGAGSSEALLSQTRITSNRVAQGFQQFWQRYRGRVPVQFVFGAVILLLLLVIRRRAPKEGDASFSSLHVIAHPYVSALLALSIAGIWLYPDAPLSVRLVEIFLTVPPLVLLLRGLIPQRLLGLFYGLAVLFVLQQVQHTAMDDALLRRTLSLLTTSIAFSGLLWGILRRAPDVEIDHWIWRFAKRVAWPLLVMLAIAAGSNILGYVALSILLAEGVLLSAYAGVLLFGLAVVAIGLLEILVRGRALRGIASIREHKEIAVRRGQWMIEVAAFLYWLRSASRAFELYDEFMEWGAAAIAASIKVGSANVSVGNILAFLVTVTVTLYVARLIRVVLDFDLLPMLKLGRGVPEAISTGVGYVVVAFGFLLAVAAAGIGLNNLTVIIGALGVGIGFGLQNLVNNFVSGVLLLFERPIKVGDSIDAQGVIGSVRRVGIRASTVRTFSGADVLVPNGHLISNEVTNWTHSDRNRRMEIFVPVKYGNEPQKVVEILNGCAAANSSVREDPEPYVLFLGFGRNALEFELRCWTPEATRAHLVKSELSMEIYRALSEANIEVPVPQREVRWVEKTTETDRP